MIFFVSVFVLVYEINEFSNSLMNLCFVLLLVCLNVENWEILNVFIPRVNVQIF